MGDPHRTLPVHPAPPQCHAAPTYNPSSLVSEPRLFSLAEYPLASSLLAEVATSAEQATKGMKARRISQDTPAQEHLNPNGFPYNQNRFS